MNTERNKTVLVTGGSGFIGSWIIIELLRRGYQVRTTVRNLRGEANVRAAVGRQVEAHDRLSFFAADLLEDKGWVEAIGKSDYLLHVASPMPVGEYRNTDIIRPAREGTQRILQAALNAGVQRVVITSSTDACTPKDNSSGAPTDETVWTDLTARNVGDYTKAKTLAEQDAWAFMKGQSGGMTLTTVLPGMVQGPVLGPDYSGSVELITRLLSGKVPRYPNIGFTTVDVRNLADLHIRAMESEAAANERFIGAGQFLWLAEIARILRERFGAKARKVPTRAIPDSVVRLLAYVSADLRFIAPNLGKRREFSAGKAAAMLGWHTPPAADVIIETAESLLNQGLA